MEKERLKGKMWGKTMTMEDGIGSNKKTFV